MTHIGLDIMAATFEALFIEATSVTITATKGSATSNFVAVTT
jgi:hypothetical protein